jgi:alpha-glucosidase (family GH31 glycosyl hydrolase)
VNLVKLTNNDISNDGQVIANSTQGANRVSDPNNEYFYKITNHGSSYSSKSQLAQIKHKNLSLSILDAQSQVISGKPSHGHRRNVSSTVPGSDEENLAAQNEMLMLHRKSSEQQLINTVYNYQASYTREFLKKKNRHFVSDKKKEYSLRAYDVDFNIGKRPKILGKNGDFNLETSLKDVEKIQSIRETYNNSNMNYNPIGLDPKKSEIPVFQQHQYDQRQQPPRVEGGDLTNAIDKLSPKQSFNITYDSQFVEKDPETFLTNGKPNLGTQTMGRNFFSPIEEKTLAGIKTTQRKINRFGSRCENEIKDLLDL